MLIVVAIVYTEGGYVPSQLKELNAKGTLSNDFVECCFRLRFASYVKVVLCYSK